MIAGMILAASGAHAQTDESSTVCVTVDFSGARMIVGGPDRTIERAVDLPAGVVSIPSARATDSYPRRVTVIQNSERYEVEFLAADGSVIATSAPTGDLPDEVEFGEWIGDLGSVDLPQPAVAVRAHHRPDLPGDNSPQSVMANELTLCIGGGSDAPACGDPGVTNNPDGSPCTTAPTVTTTTVDTTNTSEDVAGPTTSTTAAPTTTSEGVTETSAPTTTAPSTSSTTAPSTTAPTTSSTTEAEEVAGPTRLADTGSDTGLLVALGAATVAVGGALVLTQRRRLM
jgi:LPXTG-motif cell wall-anchored protein